MMQHKTTLIESYPYKKVEHVSPLIASTRRGKYVDISH